jgi:DNA-directed RNA polymerase subunit RPC12/RpoP
MAIQIDIVCPECQKQMKAPEELQGKKIRCKECGHVFVVTARKPHAQEEDANPYGVVQDEEGVPRCPHCAQEMESAEAVICIHCGYNTATRQRVGTRKVIEHTPGDQFSWLLPGIVAALSILLLFGLDLFYCLAVPGLVENGDYEFIGYKGFRLWFVIMSLFAMFFAGKFAWKRLVVQPTPPERIKGD